MMKKTITLLTVSALVLTACGGNKTQDDKQILKAIDTYHSQNPLCMAMPPAIDSGTANVLGSETVRFLKTDANGKRMNSNAVKQMSVLTKAGMYRQRKDEKSPDIGKKAWVAVYELTDKGAKFTTGNWGNRQLCLGTLMVADIDWYSQPTADKGLTVSRVSYHGKYRLHKWANKLLKASNNPQLEHDLTQPAPMQAVVVKTNKGWIDMREVEDIVDSEQKPPKQKIRRIDNTARQYQQ